MLGGNRGEAFGRCGRLFVDEAAGHAGLAAAHFEILGKARAFGAGAAVVLAREHAAADGRIGDQADTFLAADLCQFILEAAVVEAEVVLDRLVARGTNCLRGFDRLHQAPRGLIRAAENAHFAGTDQLVERFHGLLVGGVMVGPVGLVEVDVIGAELLQAVFHRADDIVAVKRGHAVALGALEPDVARARDLGGENDRIARLGLEPLADDFLGAADPLDVRRHGIAFGSVEEIDAGIVAHVEDAHAGGFIGLAAEGHRAHADIGNDNGGSAEAAVLHV